MRSDMKKVLCERPRAHSSYCYRDVRQKENRGDPEDLPHFQGIRRPYSRDDQKGLTDHIMPLIRFMWSSIGKPYNEVWADVCRSITPSFMGDHVLGHARDEIDTNCFMIGDEIWTRGSGVSGGERPVKGLYVDLDGIIRATHPDRGQVYSYRSKSKLENVWYRGYHYVKHEDGVLRPAEGWRYHSNDNRVPIKPLDDDTDALLLGGIWYKVTYAQVPSARIVKYIENDETKFRRVNEQRLDAVNLNTILSGDWYYATKRQMTSSELRKHHLKNL